MRIPAFPLIAASVLLAVPAFAQSSNMTTSAAGASNLPPDTRVTLDTQQKLKQSLEQGGFQDVLREPILLPHSCQSPGRVVHRNAGGPRPPACHY